MLLPPRRRRSGAAVRISFGATWVRLPSLWKFYRGVPITRLSFCAVVADAVQELEAGAVLRWL